MSAIAEPITRLAENFPSARPKVMREKRVVSVSPFKMWKQQPLGGCLYIFEIPAQERNGYHILTVADSFQMIPGGFDELGDANPTASLFPAPVSAEVIAHSLVSEWTRTPAPRGSTGVCVMPDAMQEGTPEFAAFLVEMSADVRTLAEWAILDAGDMFNNGRGKDISNGFHRLLTRWLMGDEGARAIPWYNAQAINTLKACIACGASINAVAKVCEKCGTDLVKYHIEYDIDPSIDPIVAMAANRVKTPKQTEGTASKAGIPLEFKVNFQGTQLPSAVRADCVTAMNGEQKAVMQTKKGQDDRDEYIISIIPDLCLKHAGLREALIGKGYVTPNTD